MSEPEHPLDGKLNKDTTAAGTESAPDSPWFKRGFTLGVILGGLALGFGVWLVIAKLPALLTSPRNAPPPTQPSDTLNPPVGTRRIHVSLFYVSQSGLELVAVGREITYGATPAEQARRIVEAQVHVPPQGQVSAIPPETSVRSVYLGSKGDAYVDLGPEIVQHHTGGALNEALAVYAIVNSLAANLQDVHTVQILIDGKEVDTLAGHIDLRRPISRNDDWVQKASKPGDQTQRPGG